MVGIAVTNFGVCDLFGGYGWALVVFGANESYPVELLMNAR